MFLILLFMFGCGGSTATDYAKARYPNCNIKEVEENTVEVKCPNKEPFIKTYRRRS